MPINDVFQANDWKIRNLLIVVLSLLLAFWGSISLDMLGLPIPFLRPLTGFLLLTFVPGILILRILRAHRFGAVKTTVYAVGLSLATLMFTGFFVNMTYPLFGIYRPISLWPLIATISVLIGILCFLAWFRDWDFATPTSINLREVFSPPVLALSLLPFGAIAGTYLMNFYDTNVLQMILLPVIALIPVVIVCTRFIPEKYYPYAVFSVAIALLYHTALISTYIWGWDIQYEYYLTNGVIQNSIWDVAAYSNCNAMLSLMTLAPIYSILLGLGVEWIFKVIYPFFFALVPLGLYVVFQRQANEKIAFLACFFFMSNFAFYGEMLSLARQEVAEFFFVLILLLIVSHDLLIQQKSFIFLITSATLVVSHYGLSYIFMLMLLLALTIATLDSHVNVLDGIIRFFKRVSEKTGLFTGLKLQAVCFKTPVIPLLFVAWYGFFLLVWYIYVASSSSFESIVYIARPILESIFSDLFNPDAAQGIAIILNETATPLHTVTKYLHLLTIFLIVVGYISAIIIRQDKLKFDAQYLLLSCGALGLCISGIVLPYFASALNTTRLYQISLILLAPFCVVGGVALLSRLKGFLAVGDHSLHVIALFLGIFLLFNSGWVYEICLDEPTSIALNNSFDSSVFSEQEVLGSLWITDAKDSRLVAADTHRRLLLSGFVGRPACCDIQTILSGDQNCYVFIGRFNMLHEHIAVTRTIGVTSSTQFVKITDFDTEKDIIYSNGGSKIYCLKTP